MRPIDKIEPETVPGHRHGCRPSILLDNIRGDAGEETPPGKRKPRAKRGFRSCYPVPHRPVRNRGSARAPYIMPSIPPMPPGGIAGPSSFFGFSATVASVVISNPAIDAAF